MIDVAVGAETFLRALVRFMDSNENENIFQCFFLIVYMCISVYTYIIIFIYL